jgi:AcrR family transcriptional regulator
MTEIEAKSDAAEPELLDRAVDAALALALERPWADVTLRDIAVQAGLRFADLYLAAGSKGAVLDALSRRLDRAALEAADGLGADEAVHDRLFETVMARVEAMEAHRTALLAIAKAQGAMRHAPRLPRTARALLEAAGVSGSGLAGAARVAAMSAVWARVVQVWRDDEGALNRTMAEIDKQLRAMRDRLGRVGAGF